MMELPAKNTRRPGWRRRRRGSGFAGVRQLALLDRVADLLLGRFLGFAVLVGVVGHGDSAGVRPPRSASIGSSNAPSRAMRIAPAAIALRALTMSPASMPSAPWPSSDSIMRRERAPIDDSTASVRAGGALRSASVTSSVEMLVEQRDPRLLGQLDHILEGEQPGTQRLQIRRAGTFEVLHHLVELVLVQFVEHAGDADLAGGRVLGRAFGEQPRRATGSR